MIKCTTENLHVEFGKKKVVDDISISFNGGEMVAIIGCNGVGKTTLIKAIAGLTRHTGKVNLFDGDKKLNTKEEIAYVPQLGSLNTKLTVFEMILLGLVNNLKWHVTKEQIESVEKIIAEMNLQSISMQSFNTLSGGQKQLVSMAQSLISKPKVLLLDEPTSALDLRHQLVVMDLAQKYTRENGAITIFVVHDLMLASRYGTKLLILDKGKIKAYDKPEYVLKPDLLEEIYKVEVSVEETKAGFLHAIPLCPL